VSADLPYVALLAADDWRPLAEYVPSRDYVYVQGFGHMATAPGVSVARRGKHPLAYWYGVNGQPVQISVTDWKPLPAGQSAHDIARELYGDSRAGAYVRPPEPIYTPAGIDAKLTPVPRELLLDMHGGAILHESAWRWTEWTLQMPGGDPGKTTEGRGGILKLRKCAFIARDGVLLTGRLERWFEFDWKITAAGRAWIEANTSLKFSVSVSNLPS